MKLKFKKQVHQTRAVESVVNCFKGQPNRAGIGYRIDPGTVKSGSRRYRQLALFEEPGFKNGEIELTERQLLENIREVQRFSKSSAVREPDQNHGLVPESRRGDGDRNRQDLLPYKDSFRDEQALRLGQVHYCSAQHCHSGRGNFQDRSISIQSPKL